MRISSLTLSRALFESVQAQPTSRGKIVARFINRLKKSHQIKKLPAILKNIEIIENKDKFFIESAFALIKGHKQEIEKMIENRFPNHDYYQFLYTVNPNLISGFKINNQSLEMNLTLDQRLNQFKENIWKRF